MLFPWTSNFGERRTSTISGRDTGSEVNARYLPRGMLSSQGHVIIPGGWHRECFGPAVLTELGRCTKLLRSASVLVHTTWKTPGPHHTHQFTCFQEAEAVSVERWELAATCHPATGPGSRPFGTKIWNRDCVPCDHPRCFLQTRGFGDMGRATGTLRSWAYSQRIVCGENLPFGNMGLCRLSEPADRSHHGCPHIISTPHRSEGQARVISSAPTFPSGTVPAFISLFCWRDQGLRATCALRLGAGNLMRAFGNFPGFLVRVDATRLFGDLFQ
jgi:hypothetical protein